MIESIIAKKHGFSLVYDEKLDIYGISNVIGYNDKEIEVGVDKKFLIVSGEKLEILLVDTEQGTINIKGNVRGIRYTNTRDKKSFFKKLIK